MKSENSPRGIVPKNLAIAEFPKPVQKLSLSNRTRRLLRRAQAGGPLTLAEYERAERIITAWQIPRQTGFMRL